MEYRNHEITIRQDDCPENPRDWGRASTIAYNHSRYILGDERIDNPIDWLCDKLGYDTLEHYMQWTENYDLGYNNETLHYMEELFGEHFLFHKLYLYDHSGITMSIHPFLCPWDSGQVGYIYIHKSDVEKVWGCDKTKALEYLENEVKEFDMYLRGDIYGYEIEGPYCNDSCYGIYGIASTIEEAKSDIDYAIKRQMCRHIHKRKQQIKNHVPFHHRKTLVL